MKGAELQTRKAGNLPLGLHWPTSVDAEDSDAFNGLLQRHAGRWTSIAFESDDEAALQVLCTSRFPRLEYLKVRWKSRLFSVVWAPNLADFQNLQEAHLPIVPSFSVSPISHSPLLLQALHLDLHSRRSFASRDLESLESLLRCIPQLIDLKVENFYTRESLPSPADTPIINLPMLRRLRFSNVVFGEQQDKIPLLAQIRTPLLEELGLRYLTDDEDVAPGVYVGGRTIFDALVTQPHALLSQPENEPLISVLRNAGPSASWKVVAGEYMAEITAKGSGRGQLDILCTKKDYLPPYILQPLAAYALRVDLDLASSYGWHAAFWEDVLDATASVLRSFTVDSWFPVAVGVLHHLSTNAPLPNSTNPRIPFLEKLCFQEHYHDLVPWSDDEWRDAVKAMLEKRRNLFIQGSVLDPPKLVVTGPHGLVFDEVEGRWLDANDAQHRS